MKVRRLRRRSSRPAETVVHRSVGGRAGLVVGLHGYGGDEHQLDGLLPIDLPVTTIVPRAPHRVEPGYGWWTPEPVGPNGRLELLPAAAIDEAAELVRRRIHETRQAEGFAPAVTTLVGYSQGATLGLIVAARFPGQIGAVAVGAGFLPPDESVVDAGPEPLDVIVMNGTLDPLITEADLRSTVERFSAAGHRVRHRLDPIPHVIDVAQVGDVEAVVAEHAGGVH